MADLLGLKGLQALLTERVFYSSQGMVVSLDEPRGLAEAGRNVSHQAECWSRPKCLHVVGTGADLKRSRYRIRIVTISEYRSNRGVKYRQQDEIQRRSRATGSSRLPWKHSIEATKRATTSAAVASIETEGLLVGNWLRIRARIVVGCVVRTDQV